ncbi:MAG TPA: DUF4157 domain-containing protein, partial [Candidatus Methanoperedens sp.]
MKESGRVSEIISENKKENIHSRTQKADFLQPSGSAADRVLFLQRTIGNQAVERLIRSRVDQAKLGIGQPKDKYEQETDKVTGMPEQKAAPSGSAHIQRECFECEEKELKRQPIEEEEEKKICKASLIQGTLHVGAPGDVYEQEADSVAEQVTNNSIFSGILNDIQLDLVSDINVSGLLGLAEIHEQGISSNDGNSTRKLWISKERGSSSQEQRIVPLGVENRIMHSKGKGSALSPLIQKTMEIQTGYDFSNVRVKTDSEAAGLNKSLGARAFTNGPDIWLGNNESVTDTKLMAHELTHVVQQGAAKRISP